MERYFVVNACESVDQKIFTLLESASINEVSIWISIIKVLVEKKVNPIVVWCFSIVDLMKN